jgi:hypothetical protein
MRPQAKSIGLAIVGGGRVRLFRSEVALRITRANPER